MNDTHSVARMLIALLLGVTSITSSSKNIQLNGISYSLKGQEASVIGLIDSTTTEIEIPQYIDYDNKKYKVTSVEEYAFTRNCCLIKVVLPETIRYIGPLAFAYCKNLNSINVSSRIDTICTDAFYKCKNLPVEDNIRYAGDFLVDVFEVDSKELFIREGCKWIGDNAFTNCHELRCVQMPNSVRVIGNFAFAGCDKMEEIVIPDSVELICHFAFSACADLRTICLPKNTQWYYYDIFIDCPKLNIIYLNSYRPPIILDDNNAHNPKIDFFYRFNSDNCTLVVPRGSKKKYKKAHGWNLFNKVICKSI